VNNLKCKKSKYCTWKQHLKKYKITYAMNKLKTFTAVVNL